MMAQNTNLATGREGATITVRIFKVVPCIKASGPGGFLFKPFNLSVKLNTDGGAIFLSS